MRVNALDQDEYDLMGKAGFKFILYGVESANQGTLDRINKGWADTLQATIVIPYPGTPLFRECHENGWLITEDWDRYDMREPVMNCPMTDKEIKELTQELYKVFLMPEYVIRRLLSIRNFHDMRFIGKGVRAVVGHLTDFSNKEKYDS